MTKRKPLTRNMLLSKALRALKRIAFRCGICGCNCYTCTALKWIAEHKKDIESFERKTK